MRTFLPPTSSVYRRLFEISYRRKLSHIGSCITALPILNSIYEEMDPCDAVVLSAGHAGLALYVTLEHHFGLDADQLFEEHGVHPNKTPVYPETDVGCPQRVIWCSAGSLGQAVTVAVGYALANPERVVWCLCSDAEANEGAFYEAARFAREHELTNLRLIVNANGWGAYRPIVASTTHALMECINPSIECVVTNVGCIMRSGDWTGDIPWLRNNQAAHYDVMDAAAWKWVEDNL